MTCEIEKVNLKPVNPSTLVMDKEGEDKLKLKLFLDKGPSVEWQEIFAQQVKAHVKPIQTLKTPKPPRGMIAAPTPKVTITYPINLEKGDIIIITSANPETVHDSIQLVMQLVINTNDQVENANIATRQRIKANEIQAKKEKDSIEKIREYLKKNPPKN